MSTGAIVMLIVSAVIVWGGLAAAVLHLRRHPEEAED
ncbi:MULTISPECIES: methionine/alanine import family NSS transporter small subunit [Streptomonospora]|uniref:Methionine/alanine import family NSS transporter small subunit n=2 Tax=Streptomonospora TaxID=104204 RepID=A0ABV9SHG2_9ACTN|nr:methionine/alanine import family NSS transporter small subunit [Streptomonospora sp. DSM 45055]MDT0302032.1 methionine/alanine import family NSS transporter small subunit [Streptomonospora sp. DSM 45055]